MDEKSRINQNGKLIQIELGTLNLSRRKLIALHSYPVSIILNPGSSQHWKIRSLSISLKQFKRVNLIAKIFSQNIQAWKFRKIIENSFVLWKSFLWDENHLQWHKRHNFRLIRRNEFLFVFIVEKFSYKFSRLFSCVPLPFVGCSPHSSSSSYSSSSSFINYSHLSLSRLIHI